MNPGGNSLTRHLLVWALGALLLVWAGFMAVGVQTGLHEAEELTDGHLASVSALLLHQQGGVFISNGARPVPAGYADLKSHDYQQSLSVVEWDAAGRMLAHTGAAVARDAGAQQAHGGKLRDEVFGELLLLVQLAGAR